MPTGERRLPLGTILLIQEMKDADSWVDVYKHKQGRGVIKAKHVNDYEILVESLANLKPYNCRFRLFMSTGDIYEFDTVVTTTRTATAMWRALGHD